MRPAALLLAVLLAAAPAAAADLVVAGSTDRAAMQPLLDGFADVAPDLSLTYLERETVELYEEARQGRLAADVVISSAADLQVRLVNDGFTRPHASPGTARLPAWARWRDEAFGFTFEPLVFVVDPARLPPSRRPRTREALARLVAETGGDRPLVATYDVGQSGIGYLAASFDAFTMSDYWPFVERIGRAGLVTACCTATVLDDVEAGRALVGYNVLGSYARARKAAGGRIEIVEPEDFTVAITRVAVILRQARNPAAAASFVDFLVSDAGQRLLGAEAVIPDPAAARGRGPIRPIALNATLLALTDPMRRSQFIALWTEVVGAGP
jgi:ABC-type Fe3+ transport system substrate-binding protein